MELDYLNYKEPLQKVTDGYGYLGALGQTKDGSKVQCHICGELYYNLGAHIFNTHQMKAREYREKFQLGLRTPLCSDQASREYKERALKLWNSKSPEEQEHQKNLMREAAAQAVRIGHTRSLEEKNRHGMCPDQLLEKIRLVADKLQKNPTAEDFRSEYSRRYLDSITRTFGSWNQAKAQLGLSPCKSGTRFPHNKGTCKFTKEELLAYLRNHYERFGKPPTASDWNRYYFPDYHIYLKQFGSIKNARKEANIT